MVGPEKIRLIGEELLGTCKTLNEVLSTFDLTEDDLSQADFSELDEIVWLCETCGWWSEPHEINEDGECDDCAADREDE